MVRETKAMRAVVKNHNRVLVSSIVLWVGYTAYHIYLKPLTKVHKKIVRLIKNLPPRAHTKPIMYDLKILNIQALYVARVCTEIHPFIHPKKALNRPDIDICKICFNSTLY